MTARFSPRWAARLRSRSSTTVGIVAGTVPFRSAKRRLFAERKATLIGCAILGIACCLGLGAAARADSEKSQSVDDQLLESLGADPIDDVDRELFAPDEEPSQPSEAPGASGTDRPPRGDVEAWKEQLLRELGAAGVSEDENPLLDVARQMRRAEGLIAETESGRQTQDVQRQIVARLDELIQQARSCSKQCSPSQSKSKVAPRRQVRQPKSKPKPKSGKPSQKPSTDPRAKPGDSGSPGLTPEQVQDLVKAVWGELPETQREQMLEWAGDEFLPKYEVLIELYFRRLAEQRGPKNP